MTSDAGGSAVEPTRLKQPGAKNRAMVDRLGRRRWRGQELRNESTRRNFVRHPSAYSDR